MGLARRTEFKGYLRLLAHLDLGYALLMLILIIVYRESVSAYGADVPYRPGVYARAVVTTPLEHRKASACHLAIRLEYTFVGRSQHAFGRR